MFGIHLTPDQVSERAECLNKWLDAQLTADATAESFTTLATFLKLSVADEKASVPVASTKEEEPVEEEATSEEAAAAPAPVKTVPSAAEPAAEPVSPTAQ